MSDVIIKGMEKMPPRCRECFAVQLWDEMDYCQIAERWQPWDAVTRPDWCPLSPAPEWISVEERLPDENTPVQVTYLGFYDKKPRADLLACVHDGMWCYWDGEPCDYEECKVAVTHWLPLPELPEVTPHD